MVRPNPDRPDPPKPQEFGLRQDRVQKLENPFTPGWKFWVPYAACVLYVLINYAPLLGSAAVIFYIAWPVTVLIVVWLPLSIAGFWARSQADYPRYRQYTAALGVYRGNLAAWERQQREWWMRLDGRSFEVEAGTVFSRRGYVVRRVGGAGDQGVDLLLVRDGLTIAVQCKAHRNPVGPGAVRDLYGALLHHHHREAWLLSTAGFTKGARAFAAGKPIRLLTLNDLL